MNNFIGFFFLGENYYQEDIRAASLRPNDYILLILSLQNLSIPSLPFPPHGHG